MFRIFKVIKEIRLYREYSRIIKKEEKESPMWKRKNLRRDSLNRVYTVINLPLQVLASVDLPRESRPSFVVQELKPINEYLKSLNLEEIITMWIEPVKGTDDESYLVVYQFLFRSITWLWILRLVLEIFAISLFFYYRTEIFSLFS
jgi:hypothetical protein